MAIPGRGDSDVYKQKAGGHRLVDRRQQDETETSFCRRTKCEEMQIYEKHLLMRIIGNS